MAKKKEQNRTEHRKKAMIKALESTLGVVTPALKITGVGRTMYYNWLKDDEQFAKDVKDLEDMALDFAESKLHEQVNAGNTTATIFYLKTKGKRRGYVERQEMQLESNEFKVVVKSKDSK